MKISAVSIKNFKSFDSTGVEFPVSDLTAFVGVNNSGKSNVIKALDLFFEYSTKKINKDCFHNGHLDIPVEISVTFTQLSDEEAKAFRSHLNPDGSLSIIQRIEVTTSEAAGSDNAEIDSVSEDKHGIIYRPILEWLSLEKTPSQTKINEWWEDNLIIQGGFDFKEFCGDPSEPPSPEEFEQKVVEFWNEHFDSIEFEKVEGDSKVLGWKNKLKGNLPKFIFIPALQTVDETIKVQKTNPFGLILNWVLGDIKAEHAAEVQRQLSELVQEAFAQAGEEEDQVRRKDEVIDTFNQFMRDQFDLELDLKFEAPKVGDILLGGVQIYGDDGYRSLLSEKGQGVQRSAVFTILRTYAHLRDKLGDVPSRSTIFAIEEPEIYLHPPIRRATFQLLRTIAKEQDQVLYSTHDGCFVDVEYFDEIRLLRRIAENDDYRTTVIYFPIENLVKDCKNRYGKDVDPISIRQRFRRFYDTATNEGFFSKKVVIVEGETESAALPIYFAALGYDIDLNEVCILHAGGKGVIDFLYIIFNELGIPTYVIFDGDAPIDGVDINEMPEEAQSEIRKKCKLNSELLKLVGACELVPGEELQFSPTIVADRVAIWENRFEVQVHHPLERYEEWKAEAKKLFGSDSKQLIARYIAQQVVEDEATEIPKIMHELQECIVRLTWEGSCLLLEPSD
jgi:putative ATP-dependent endonuclease of OLD family